MLWLPLSLALSMAARADTFTLDNGTLLEGALAEYTLNGSCQVSITQGPLVGALVVLPCERIARFERHSVPLVAPPAPALSSYPLAPAPTLQEEEEEEVVAEVPLALPLSPSPEAAFTTAPYAAEESPGWSEEEEVEVEVFEADTAAAAPQAPERSIGGVVLPTLPNLRVLRRPTPPPTGSGDEEGETL